MKDGDWKKVNKKCTKCTELKPYSEFHKKSANPDDYSYFCKECRKPEIESYAIRNRSKIAEKTRNWRLNNLERDKEVHKVYRLKNKETLNKKTQTKKRDKRKTDQVTNIKERISRKLRRILTKEAACKVRSAFYDIIGLTGYDLVNHLHLTFEYNYGIPREHINLKDVEIDHIIPLSTAQTIEDVKCLNHYTNLQLLFKEDNREKGIRIIA